MSISCRQKIDIGGYPGPGGAKIRKNFAVFLCGARFVHIRFTKALYYILVACECIVLRGSTASFLGGDVYRCTARDKS